MPSIDFPPMRDACWSDPAWRTQTLLSACAQFEADVDVVADLTGVSPNTARLWLNRHKDTIPAAHLRALLYDLNARAGTGS